VRAGLRGVRAEERRHFDAAAVLVCGELFWDLGKEWNWNLVFWNQAIAGLDRILFCKRREQLHLTSIV
jgi:hypothetical protein